MEMSGWHRLTQFFQRYRLKGRWKDELFYCLLRTARWRQLFDLLTHFDHFHLLLCSGCRSDMFFYWRVLEEKAGLNLCEQ